MVLMCGSKEAPVSMLSDNYTSGSRASPFDDWPRKLTGTPGQLYSLQGKLVGDGGDHLFHIRSDDKMLPLELVKATGLIDGTIGIYENAQFRLDLSSRNSDKIRLFDKRHNEDVGDCEILWE